MERSSFLGLGLVLSGTFVGALMKGVSPMAFLSVPAALLIVIVAAIGASIMANTSADLAKMPRVLAKAFRPGPPADASATVAQIVQLADRARREGLLALEDQADGVADPFLRRGLQMVIDGADAEVVRDTLETDVAAMRARHQVGARFVTTIGVFAPTFGIIGAVVGLIATLSSLADPQKLGEGIAAAFIATFWGVFAANGLFLPIGRKLTRMSEEEAAHREMIIEGVLSIQAGASPRVVGELLWSFVPPTARVVSTTEAARPEEERRSA